jgi:hypothetical protein
MAWQLFHSSLEQMTVTQAAHPSHNFIQSTQVEEEAPGCDLKLFK